MQTIKKPYYLYRKLESGKWKYCEAYSSLFDERCQEDINFLRQEGYKLKATKVEYYGEFPIFEDK